MAYAALVSLAQTIDQILNHDQYSISLQEKQQIISLDKYVILLQAFLENFLEKANSLEGRMRDIANEAEDIIEYLMWERVRSRNVKSANHPSGKHTHQLKKVTEKIDSIAGEVMGIKDSFRMKDVQLSADSSAAGSSSRAAPIHKDAMVGFDDDLIELKTQLCGESSKLQVIPIFGMGGIGKTMLARNAYDDPLIMEHFEIRAWVTVSQDYSAQEILSGLLVSMKNFNTKRSGQGNEEKVYKNLKSRRYLIVMDDMWSTKAWDDVRNIFPDDGNGSRIMLTTRLLDVAAYPDPYSRLYEMRFMDEDQSWDLLRQKVFTHQDCPSELEDIGKTIARSCRGLPLAIVVIAGVLSTVSKTQASWEEIAKNVSSAVATNDVQFEKILSLSYTQLPHHLRPCFLYMGCFPEDYEIHVSKLVQLWVAEGFLECSNGSKCFEEVAEECVEDLVKRSLVLVTDRKSNGKIKSCSLHDLMRDLCITKAQQEKFLLNVRHSYVDKDFLESIKNQRRISIDHSILNHFAHIYGSTIRTIICFRCEGRSLGSLVDFRLLRVLILLGVLDVVLHSVMPLPKEVFQLFHLRYLSFAHPDDIPAAISNLQNLQTLIIHSTMHSLPLAIWRMSQLRHLVSLSFDHLPVPVGATFVLDNLQTLSAVTDLICTKRILKMIPNLKKLAIIYSEDNCDWNYQLHNLVHLHQLEKLKLSVDASPPFLPNLNAVFPRTLKKLTLSCWQLSWKDMMLVGLLPNLQVLKLRGIVFQDDKWETTEGEFLELKFLLIEDSTLQHWITESSHFPRLKCLLLCFCSYLSEIPDDIAEIPTLELIEVKGWKKSLLHPAKDWNKSLVDSAKRIEEEQKSCGNDAIQVRCVLYDTHF